MTTYRPTRLKRWRTKERARKAWYRADRRDVRRRGDMVLVLQNGRTQSWLLCVWSGGRYGSTSSPPRWAMPELRATS